MPVFTHKLTSVRCLLTPRGGREAIMAIRCTCDEGCDSAPSSVALQWWQNHIDHALGVDALAKTAALDHVTAVAFGGGR